MDRGVRERGRKRVRKKKKKEGRKEGRKGGKIGKKKKKRERENVKRKGEDKTEERRIIWRGPGNPLWYSCLENPMDGWAWWAAVHGLAKSRTRLSDFTFTFHFHALEKEMVAHSSVLAWRIPGTEEPGGLPSMGSHRVGHDWSDLAAAAAEFP